MLFRSIVTPEDLLPYQLSPMLASTYSFTSAAFQKPVHTARWNGRNLSGDDPLSKSTLVEISILICELKPYQVWFSFLRKRYPVECEPFSSPEPVVSWSRQIKPSGTGDENECEHNLAPEQALFVAFFQGSEGKLEASMERSTPASRFLCSPENPAKIMLVLHTTEHAALS